MGVVDVRSAVAERLRELEHTSVGWDRESFSYELCFHKEGPLGRGWDEVCLSRSGFRSPREASAAHWDVVADEVLRLVSARSVG